VCSRRLCCRLASSRCPPLVLTCRCCCCCVTCVPQAPVPPPGPPPLPPKHEWELLQIPHPWVPQPIIRVRAGQHLICICMRWLFAADCLRASCATDTWS
jgi:hypothetical protein